MKLIQHFEEGVLLICNLDACQLLRFKLVRGDHKSFRNDYLLEGFDQVLRNVELTIIAENWIANVLQVAILGLNSINHVGDCVEESL